MSKCCIVWEITSNSGTGYGLHLKSSFVDAMQYINSIKKDGRSLRVLKEVFPNEEGFNIVPCLVMRYDNGLQRLHSLENLGLCDCSDANVCLGIVNGIVDIISNFYSTARERPRITCAYKGSDSYFILQSRSSYGDFFNLHEKDLEKLSAHVFGALAHGYYQ